MEKTIVSKILGKPYFVLTSDEEIFRVIGSVSSNKKEFNWNYNYNEETEELILGRDIIEVPTRGLNLLVNKCDKMGLEIINKSQKFAKLCLCDYVGLEKINGDYSGKAISKNYIKIQPRLFRKIIDN